MSTVHFSIVFGAILGAALLVPCFGSTFSTCDTGASKLSIVTKYEELPVGCRPEVPDALQEALFECLGQLDVTVNGCTFAAKSTLELSTTKFPCYVIDFKNGVVTGEQTIAQFQFEWGKEGVEAYFAEHPDVAAFFKPFMGFEDPDMGALEPEPFITRWGSLIRLDWNDRCRYEYQVTSNNAILNPSFATCTTSKQRFVLSNVKEMPSACTKARHQPAAQSVYDCLKVVDQQNKDCLAVVEGHGSADVAGTAFPCTAVTVAGPLAGNNRAANMSIVLDKGIMASHFPEGYSAALLPHPTLIQQGSDSFTLELTPNCIYKYKVEGKDEL